MVTGKPADRDIEVLQAKCDGSEWSLSDDSALCHVLERCRDHYTEHVEKLGHEIAKINQLAALLNSGIGHLNGSLTHVANSRFIQQHLSEDGNSRVPATDEVPNNTSDGRADTIATISAAIRQGIVAASSMQNMNDLCSTRPVIGSVSFGSSFLTPGSNEQKQGPVRMTGSAPVLNAPVPYPQREPSTSASDEGLVRAPQSTVQPVLVPPRVESGSDILPRFSTPSPDSSVRSLFSVPVPKSEVESASSVDAAKKSDGDTSSFFDRPINSGIFIGDKTSSILQAPKSGTTDIVPGVSVRPKTNIVTTPKDEIPTVGVRPKAEVPSVSVLPKAEVSSVGVRPKTEVPGVGVLPKTDSENAPISRNSVPSINVPHKSKEDKMKTTTPVLSNIDAHAEVKPSEGQAKTAPEEKIVEKDDKKPNVADNEEGFLKSGNAIKSITKKYASIFDSDSDDDSLFLDPRKSLLSSGASSGPKSLFGSVAENDEESMKKGQIPKKLDTSAFSKVLADKLTKGPVLAPSASVQKPAKESPELVKKSAEPVKESSRSSQKGNSETLPSWPLPSVAKTRPKGPLRRPPSRTHPTTVSTSAAVPEKPSPAAPVDAIQAPSNSSLSKADEVAVKRKDESPTTTKVADRKSAPTVQREEPKPAAARVEPKPTATREDTKTALTRKEPKTAVTREEPKPAATREEPKATAMREEPKQASNREEPKPTATKASTVTSLPPRTNASKTTRSFFDSESDDENGAGDNSKSVVQSSSVSTAAIKGKSSAREDSRPGIAKSQATSQAAPAQKLPTTKSQFAKGLFDDDEDDDDLSLFRKPKGS